METPPVQIDKPNMVKLFVYISVVALIGAILGLTLVYIIKSHIEVAVVESSTNESSERYLNPIDRDPVKGVVYKVPSGDEAIKVYTGKEKDSPIDGFIRKRKGSFIINKHECGYTCNGTRHVH